MLSFLALLAHEIYQLFYSLARKWQSHEEAPAPALN